MKRKNRPAEDRLSALPDEMLECILSHLASDEAVRTSVLSRRWRDVYEAVPVVDLVDHKEGRHVGSLEDPPVCFDQKVTGAILCKAPGTPIRTFRLDAFFPPQDLLDQWIASAVSSGVEDIDVKIRYSHDRFYPGYFQWNRYVKTHHSLFGSLYHVVRKDGTPLHSKVMINEDGTRLQPKVSLNNKDCFSNKENLGPKRPTSQEEVHMVENKLKKSSSAKATGTGGQTMSQTERAPAGKDRPPRNLGARSSQSPYAKVYDNNVYMTTSRLQQTATTKGGRGSQTVPGSQSKCT